MADDTVTASDEAQLSPSRAGHKRTRPPVDPFGQSSDRANSACAQQASKILPEDARVE